MKKISMYSLVIGIGLGLIIASIWNIVYTELTDSYGFYQESIFKRGSNEDASIEKTGVQKQTDKKDLINATSKSELAVVDNSMGNNLSSKTYYQVFIREGMNSKEIAELLEGEGVIKNQESFNRLAGELEITRNFQYGLKSIPANSSLEEIMLILTKN